MCCGRENVSLGVCESVLGCVEGGFWGGKGKVCLGLMGLYIVN